MVFERKQYRNLYVLPNFYDRLKTICDVIESQEEGWLIMGSGWGWYRVENIGLEPLQQLQQKIKEVVPDFWCEIKKPMPGLFNPPPDDCYEMLFRVDWYTDDNGEVQVFGEEDVK